MADVKEKIALLLNLASNNPSENEARAALLKARASWRNTNSARRSARKPIRSR